MAIVQTQINIDEELEHSASAVLKELGLDISSAVSMFLRQVDIRRAIPFEVKLPDYKPEVIEAFEEAERISGDPDVKAYDDVNEMFKEILADEGQVYERIP